MLLRFRNSCEKSTKQLRVTSIIKMMEAVKIEEFVEEGRGKKGRMKKNIHFRREGSGVKWHASRSFSFERVGGRSVTIEEEEKIAEHRRRPLVCRATN